MGGGGVGSVEKNGVYMCVCVGGGGVEVSEREGEIDGGGG